MGIIEIQGLTKTYKSGFWGRKRTALKGLDLEVEKGETFGYLGPNGAGKTTTLKILLGLIYADAGSAMILDRPLGDISIKSKIGYLPEQTYFYDYLTGKELLEFYAHFFGLGRQDRKKRISDLLHMVSLSGKEDIALRKYSKGMLQRIGIAQALINDPQVIFMDEPLSGLDPLGRKDVKDIILRLKGEGKTIFFCSHILPDVEMICDRVAILDSGRLVAVGHLDELLQVKAEGLEIEFMGVNRACMEEIKQMAEGLIEQSNRVQITVKGDEDVMKVIRFIDKNGGKVLRVLPHRKSLEDIFVSRLGQEKA